MCSRIFDHFCYCHQPALACNDYYSNVRANYSVKSDNSYIDYKIKRLNTEIADSFLYSHKILLCTIAKKI